MRLHRIALAAYSATAADTFNGQGSLTGKGRWHTGGRPIVYAAQSISLAMAENLVHLQRSNNIAAFHRWEIELPDALILQPPRLRSGWRQDLALTRAFGDAWLASQSSVAQLVPSALVPNEMNCLINPGHARFSLKWVVSGPHPFAFDSRLTQP